VTGLQICFWYKEKIVEIKNIRMGLSFDRHYFAVIEDIEEQLVDPMPVPAGIDNQEMDVELSMLGQPSCVCIRLGYAARTR
jgi:hypothetical protein